MSGATLRGVLVHVSAVPAGDRAAFAELVRAHRPDGSIVVETCHRVELYAVGEDPAADLPGTLPAGVLRLEGDEVARHVIALAVGLRSTVVGEDQVLHQLRTALESARARGPLPAQLDRLFDLALRTGRRARTLLPAHRPTLADLALGMTPVSVAGRRVLVVGAGEMGRHAATAAMARGASVEIASRTPERAEAAANDLRVGLGSFDPGDGLRDFAVIVVALRGRWRIGPASRAALLASGASVVDLSSPPALPRAVAAGLGERLITIDDVALRTEHADDDRVVARLRRLADGAYADHRRWLERQSDRDVARTMADLADAARNAELAELWRRVPELGSDERDQIERMTRHLAERILREPLERLGRDVDGRHEQAARELFGL